MKPNGGIYFQPSGVNSLSGFGGGQATRCLSNMLSFRLANKQQNKYVSVFSQRDGETEISFFNATSFSDKFLLLLPAFVHNYLYFLLLTLEKKHACYSCL